MEIKIPIKKRNRDFGIITWPYSFDFEIKTLFAMQNEIDVEFNEKILKKRKVSYKYRRFSIGRKRLEVVENKQYFLISKNEDLIKIVAI
ncbi:MAG: hypothetical protein MUE85_16200 [Microscillaceae bacterium]|jgi:hypothetical protein|nr:hypothetical protein [Microscillaceae bacterium]